MKMPYFPSLLSLVLTAGFVSTPLATLAASQTTTPPVLQVSVDVPPTWRPMLEDDIADAFFYRIRDTFKSAGLQGELKELSRGDQANETIPVLEIRLMEWRINRIGNIDCTFGASLKQDGKEHNLGLFSGTSLVWTMGVHDRWDLSRGFDDSAQSALKDLYRKLVAKKLLPAPVKS